MTIKFDKRSDLALVADIGGTQIRAGLVDKNGKIHERKAILTEQRNGIDSATERLVEIVAQLPSSDVAGFCIASAGPIDPETGFYSYPPSLSAWHGRTMKGELERALQMPVYFGHDATLAALAEVTFGKYKGMQHFIYLTISTGIGGGIITNGQMVTGANGYAGEVGHIIVQSDSPFQCGGECRGCFEGLASGTAIINIAKHTLSTGVDSSMNEEINGDWSKLDTMLVFDHATKGDKVAFKIIDDVITNLAIGISSLLNIFDPNGMTLGGGVMNSLNRYWDQLDSRIRKHSLPRFRDAVPVAMTELGGDICMLGAAARILHPPLRS